VHAFSKEEAMALMKGMGPFGESPAGVFNFEVGAPNRHALYFEDSPRRVRVDFGGEVIADSRRVTLLHETGLMPVYYFPAEDVRRELLRPSERRTRCPYKGEARYHSVVVGDRVAKDAVWSYPEPLAGAPPLAGYFAFYWDRMERWREEDEEVFGHARDPYHRIDVLPAGRPVRVRVGGEIVAETNTPRVLFETGLRPRYYLEPGAVRAEVLAESATHTRCPYKGLASYKHVRVGGTAIDDAVWYYPEPLRDARDVGGWYCFYDEKEGVDVEIG
jgi:uncharacterized protein (DUF427 family)